MTPFFHPTSILVLDDDPLFLESIDFQFSDELSCQTYTRPDAALDHLHSQDGEHPDFGRYFKDCSDLGAGDELPLGDRLLRLQLSELRSIMDEPARHQRISVAIVDYDMPKMTGIEFCRAIRDLPVKTILLTGKAGLETAISAFNEGLIDCFLQKQDVNVSSSLRREIKRLQEAYFAGVSEPIKNALALQRSHFLDDPAFIELFKAVAKDHNVIEHYISASPPGIVMRDADGNESLLLVSDTEIAKAHCEAAESHNAPSDMIELLRGGRAQAWFPTREGAYHPDFASSWNRYIWPAQALPGSGSWNYSVIRQEPSAAESALQARSA